MWEDERKNTVKKIILAVLCLAIIAGLAFAVLTVRKQEAVQDAQLLELYAQQQTAQQEARQASVDEVVAQYEADAAAVQQYLPGILCIGDKLTEGTSGGVSYPSVLQKMINENLCDAYDFRSTVRNADDFNNRLEWKDFTIEIPVINYGTGKETMDTLLGRTGAVPFVTSGSMEIPGDCVPVRISLKLQNGAAVRPLTGTDVGINDVTVAGVEGKLSVVSANSWGTEYAFTRNEPGEPVPVPGGEPVITSGTENYHGYIPVIFAGSFSQESSKDLVAKIRQILDAYEGPEGRYIVIGNYYRTYNGGYGELGSTNSLSSQENLMQQAFGEHYINFRKYLASDAMADAGLTPTKTDTKNMQDGIVPESLVSRENREELTSAGYQLLGKLVYDRFEQLGYFDEVVDELQIESFGRESNAGK